MREFVIIKCITVIVVVVHWSKWAIIIKEYPLWTKHIFHERFCIVINFSRFFVALGIDVVTWFRDCNAIIVNIAVRVLLLEEAFVRIYWEGILQKRLLLLLLLLLLRGTTAIERITIQHIDLFWSTDIHIRRSYCLFFQIVCSIIKWGFQWIRGFERSCCSFSGDIRTRGLLLIKLLRSLSGLSSCRRFLNMDLAMWEQGGLWNDRSHLLVQ